MHTGQNIFKFKCIYIELFVMLTDIRTYIHLCQKKKHFSLKIYYPLILFNISNNSVDSVVDNYLRILHSSPVSFNSSIISASPT